MKIGAFITITRPEERGDLYKECIEMANECFDTVTIIDGQKTWPQEFNWPLIGEHFQRGYEQTDAEWVFHLDTDFIFHEQDYAAIRKACEDNNEEPALSFWKYQSFTPDRYNLKSRLVIAVNKGKYGDRIRFDGGLDLCQPTLDGKYILSEDVPESRVPFYNYDFLLKTKGQVKDDIGRMDRAYHRHFGQWLYSHDGTEESAYKGWLQMVLGRYSKHGNFLEISDHPKVMQDTIKKIRPNQCGYSIFGNVSTCKYFVNNDIIEL